MATQLVNNGLRQGLNFKDLNVGDVILTEWLDTEPQWMLIIDAPHADKRPTYKGRVSFDCLDVNGTRQSVEGDQIVEKSRNLSLKTLLSQ